jgi:hypothetical protein
MLSFKPGCCSGATRRASSLGRVRLGLAPPSCRKQRRDEGGHIGLACRLRLPAGTCTIENERPELPKRAHVSTLKPDAQAHCFLALAGLPAVAISAWAISRNVGSGESCAPGNAKVETRLITRRVRFYRPKGLIGAPFIASAIATIIMRPC